MISSQYYQDTEADVEGQSFTMSGPVAVPMRPSDIWKASESIVDAFENDPYLLYLQADGKPISKYRQRAVQAVTLTLWHKNQIIFTVDGGASIAAAAPPPSTPKTPIDRLKDRLSLWFFVLTHGKLTAEQKKRRNEAGVKLRKVISEVLPAEKMQEMFYVDLVATDPRSQGRGFGGAALGEIVALADSQGRACWLLSSNTTNDIFYNSLGFETVGQFYVGDDNPEWKTKPVLAQVMIREPAKKPQRNLSKIKPMTTYFNSLVPFVFFI